MIRVSIVMAVYNGDKFIRQQIDSIMSQMKSDDELIISVDPSIDDSKKIALDYADKDKRLRVLDGPGMGVVKNFENALNAVNGEYIFLSDQDDIWLEDKMSRVLDVLMKENVLAALHDATVVDEDLNTLSKSYYKNTFYSGILKNIIRNKYTGCCMAFKRSLLEYTMPFPENLPMHDQWLGIAAKKFGDVEFIDKPLIYYRRHKMTVTGHEQTGIFKKAKWRLCIFADYIRLGGRA